MNFKLINVAILSVLVMVSCSKDEVVSNADTSSQNAITFNALSSLAQTKATPINSSNLTTTDFDVFAFTQDGKAFMGNVDTDFAHDGVKIVYKNGKWDYDDPNELAYWPTTDNPLDFYAISPAVSIVDDNYTLHYTWNFNPASQKIHYLCMDEYAEGTDKHADHDVMYGIAKAQTKITNNGVVKFTFKHILSQIVFKARTELESMNVTIKDIKIHNAKISGTFTLPTDASTHATAANWELPSLGNYNPVVIRNASVEVNSSTTVTDISSATPIFTIPQTLTKWVVSGYTKTKLNADNAGQSYLEIACKIKQNGVYLFGSENKFNTLYVPFGVSWEPGYRYIYTLIFGGGYDDQGEPILTPITFDADVEEWADEEMNVNTSVGGVN